ncbi:hypothetical protein [Microbispora siamensis]|uniref:Uncharacterized protein n=1 Tax=Microbispora siamensis TaxID=564413 RepID=A0ABQ4GNE5_9ACTN|nr:hypothetical protein [Microbispora siamensis]GIH62941.1 hypothetical protein Msi02_37580 [Microbispora siamensis]
MMAGSNVPWRMTGGLLLVLVLGAGCAQQSEKDPGRFPVVSSEKDLVLPLDAYDLDAQGRSVVQTARYKLIARCLARYHFKMKPHDTSPVNYPRNAAYLGWLGARDVSRYGYIGPPEQQAGIAAALDGIRGYQIPPSYEPIFTGSISEYKGMKVPKNGCDGEAQSILNGNTPGPDNTTPAAPSAYKNLYSFMEDAATAGYADDRVELAEELWSRCMKDAGFQYRRTWEAETDKRWTKRGEVSPGGTPAGPGPDEIRTATADERCRLKVNYSGIRLAAYADSQRAIISRNKPAIERLKTLIRVRYENSLKVLNGNFPELPSSR